MGVPRPDDDALGETCVRHLCRDAGWIKRRKELCTVITDRTIHRSISVDLEVPDEGEDAYPLVETDDGQPVDWLPLFVLPKAPKRMTRFDFRDEGGRALPLPTRAENAEVSVAAIQELAAQTLHLPKVALPPDIADDLREIALEDATRGRRLQREKFPVPPEDPPLAGDRGTLANDQDFAWFLRLIAEHSIVVVPLVNSRRQRRIIKVAYDEKIRYPRGRLLNFAEKFGWRGYVLTLDHPFIGATNYHFEFDAPEDMQITDAGLITRGADPPLDAVSGVTKRVHFYVPEAVNRRRALSFAQLRVRGRSFTGGAVLIAAVIAALLYGGAWQAPELAKGSNGAPSLLLVFPGLVAAYIAREEHPLVTRLLAFARRVLLLTAGIALLAAARLVIVTKEHPANKDVLGREFLIAALVATVMVFALLLTRQLPLKLASRLRRKTRLYVPN